MFELGGIYQDRRGSYTCLELRGGKIYYAYDEAPKVTVVGDVDIKWSIHASVQSEKKSSPLRDDGRYSYINHPDCQQLIEWLLDHGWIQADVPEKFLDRFQRRYFALTETWVTEDTTGITIVRDGSKWGVAMTIVASNPKLKELCPASLRCLQSEQEDGHVTYSINNTKFVWELIEFGFMLGCSHRKKHWHGRKK